MLVLVLLQLLWLVAAVCKNERRKISLVVVQALQRSTKLVRGLSRQALGWVSQRGLGGFWVTGQ